jgi:hypothetical protein
MDDALFVRGFECLGNLLGDRERLIHWDGPLRDAVGERRPFHKLHDERLHAVRLLEAVNVSNIGMIERGEELRLSLKSSEPIRV